MGGSSGGGDPSPGWVLGKGGTDCFSGESASSVSSSSSSIARILRRFVLVGSEMGVGGRPFLRRGLGRGMGRPVTAMGELDGPADEAAGEVSGDGAGGSGV